MHTQSPAQVTPLSVAGRGGACLAEMDVPHGVLQCDVVMLQNDMLRIL